MRCARGQSFNAMDSTIQCKDGVDYIIKKTCKDARKQKSPK